MHALPVSTDFPRLAKLTKIYDDDQQEEVHLPESNGNIPSSSVERIIYGMLLVLALQLDDSQSHESTQEHFWNYLQENMEGEVRLGFDRFLKNCLKEDGKVALVLKTINQGILAPSVIFLKLGFPSFKDCSRKNSWRVEIHFSTQYVMVVHIRREQSFHSPPNPEMQFEFLWECSILFDRPLSIMKSVSIKVKEIAFAPSSNRSRILHEMKNFTAEDCVFTTIPA